MLRLIYWCKPDELFCHKCSKPLRFAATHGPNYTVATCINGRGGEHCGERLLLLPPDPKVQFSEPRTTIIRLTKSEAAAITNDKTANEVLKDIGAFAMAASELDRTG